MINGDIPLWNINRIYNKHVFSIKVSKPDYWKQKFPNPQIFEPSIYTTIRGRIQILFLGFTYDLNLISLGLHF